ncbi:MAG: 50S ribosomal protein L13 [Sedimentisphaerales bacterium]|jgi:large subunit ribosomal protein L13|nr:50S ribosomal protein L13 [Sedimentisphaerales bacterium]
MNTTYMAKKDQVARNWYLVDASGLVLGRMASKIASILMGKHKRYYTPHVDTGDFVVVVNAEKVVLTGRKAQQKFYQRYSHYPGGQKCISYGEMLRDKPEQLIELAVRRMMPCTGLARRMLKKLKVYRGPEHPHQAQRPVKIDLLAKVN